MSFDENTTIYAGGVQYAASGTSGTLILSGGQQVLNAVEVVSAVVGAGGLQIVGFTIPTYARVLSALSLDTVVSGAGAGVIVDGVLPGPDEPDAGGETRSMTLVSGGFEIVSGGAFAEETTVAAGGYLVELPGADVIDSMLSGGTVVSSGVVLFNPYQPLKVDGLVASGLTVSSGGAEYVYYGGSETGGTVFGTQIVSKGTIYDVTVLSGGQTFLKGGGEQGFVASAVGITAGFGGQVWVEGATVIGCTVMDGGLLVANTLYAEQAGVDGLVIESGGSARIEDQISGEPTIAGGTLQLVADAYGANVALGAVSFSGAGGVLEVDAALTGTVYGFGLGDSVEIDLGDSSPDYGLIGTVAATIGAGNVLSATANGEVYTFHLDPDAIYSEDQILVSGNELTLEALCLCRGTRVAVPGGEVAVEDLRVGGVVETELGPRAVRWIGRRRYDGRFIAGNVLALPVCIKPR